jgi:hypothetical protein
VKLRGLRPVLNRETTGSPGGASHRNAAAANPIEGQGRLIQEHSMANHSETRAGNTPGTWEDQSGSSTQGNRGSQSGTSSHMSGGQSSQQHSGPGTGSTPTGRPDDKVKKGNQPGGSGSGTQHSGSGSGSGVNAGSTGTSSGQISPHSDTPGQTSGAGRSGTSGQSSGGDRNT